ncbi:MAG: outer membrane lipoprotein-sorting protein [Gemmatimonadota bacterium]
MKKRAHMDRPTTAAALLLAVLASGCSAESEAPVREPAAEETPAVVTAGDRREPETRSPDPDAAGREATVGLPVGDAETGRALEEPEPRASAASEAPDPAVEGGAPAVEATSGAEDDGSGGPVAAIAPTSATTPARTPAAGQEPSTAEILRETSSAYEGLLSFRADFEQDRAQFVGDPVQRFEATYHGREPVGERDAYVLTLVPRRPAGYERLKVWIDADDHLVRRFELTEASGNVRRVQLHDFRANPSLPDDLFEFTPPPGAQVVTRG